MAVADAWARPSRLASGRLACPATCATVTLSALVADCLATAHHVAGTTTRCCRKRLEGNLADAGLRASRCQGEQPLANSTGAVGARGHRPPFAAGATAQSHTASTVHRTAHRTDRGPL